MSEFARAKQQGVLIQSFSFFPTTVLARLPVPRLTAPPLSGHGYYYRIDARFVQSFPTLRILAMKMVNDCFTCLRNRPRAKLADTSTLA